MREIVDATWRALAYCLHPWALLWSLLPLALAAGTVFGLGWFYWEPSVAGLRALLDQWELLNTLFEWLESIGAHGLRTVLAPLILVALAMPAVVLGTLLLVAWLLSPAMVSLVVRRRFPALQRSPAAPGRLAALGWSVLCTLFAAVALVLSVPLWFVPPLVLVLPPLIWGWLSYRVLTFDALAQHADAHERHFILHTRRWPLRAAGLVCGVLGAMPSAMWATGAAALIFAPLLMLLAVWLYTVLFAFTSLWFAHYTLAALHALRTATEAPFPVSRIDPQATLPGRLGR